MRRLHFLFFLIATPLAATSQHTITYIANEGILIQSENKKILIDAIFDDYYKDYLAPSAQTISNINAKASPYQSIDLLLVTHAHLDHFNPSMVSKFLTSHRETELLCPDQAIDSISNAIRDIDPLIPRLNGLQPKPEWQSPFLKGISIQTAYVRHGGQQNYEVDNQIYLINVDGRKILHLGDAEMDLSHFVRLHQSQPPIDIALIPYWFLVYPEGVDIIKTQIKPTKIVAIHYPKVGDPKSLQKIRENFPNAVVFTKEGQSVEF